MLITRTECSIFCVCVGGANYIRRRHTQLNWLQITANSSAQSGVTGTERAYCKYERVEHSMSIKQSKQYALYNALDITSASWIFDGNTLYTI